MHVRYLTLLFVSLAMASSGFAAAPEITEEQHHFFETHIRPALVKHCYSCHSTDEKIRGGLLLDSRDGWMLGRDSGPAIIPGKPAQSLLYDAITWADPDVEMPPKNQMPASDIANFKKWIEMGAPDPRIPEKRVVKTEIDIEAGKQFWAFQAPKHRPPPNVKNPDWPSTKVDHFVLAKMETKGLQPAPHAEPIPLLRRLNFDLTGLPPTREEAKAFEQAWQMDREAAYNKKVDELLARPQYGERFGQHWLDVARYAESSGKDINALYPQAWRYRDYVIDAFNADKPFDDFIREQIAGDLLPAKNDEVWQEHLIATGFLAMGTKTLNDQNPRQFAADLADEQLDTTFTAFMGLTVACARCHDHKSDPIPTTDYYALAGVFMSTKTYYGTISSVINRRNTKLLELPIPDRDPLQVRSEQELRILKNRLEDLEAEQQELIQTVARARSGNRGNNMMRPGDTLDANTQQRFVQLRSIIPALRANFEYLDEEGQALSMCMGVQEQARVIDPVVLVRGELDKPAQAVDRGFLQVLHREDSPPFSKRQSGRRELANELASEQNPLTARVMVNRIWRSLFNRGLVDSPNNFGETGQRPSHPELLDHLALEFVKHDWSVKQLVRSLVLSKTYRQSSTFSEANFTRDPDNQFYWRTTPRALDAEQLRDAMLLVSDRLDRQRPNGSLVAENGDGVVGRRLDTSFFNQSVNYRSIYLPRPRDAMPESLALFDIADNNRSTGKRDQTNVPGQALYLMNNAFVIEQSKALAQRLIGLAPEPRLAIPLGFEICFNRAPSEAELAHTRTLFERFHAMEGESLTGRSSANRDAYFAFCQSLIASAEFRYLN